MPETLFKAADLAVHDAAPVARWLLHADPEDAATVAAALGLDLPAAMLRAGEAGGWHALHLAPDEWLLVGADGTNLPDARNELPPLSLVEVSDRTVAVEIAGPAAATLLAAGCPLDLAEAAFPDGACSRTVFGKAPVMLWRRGATWWLECARSYSDYVALLLRTAAEDPR